jgi:hypothetical protein
MDTAPLDLARAAHILTNASVPRGLCYGHLKHHHKASGSWALCSNTLWLKHGHDLIAQCNPTSTEILFIPPAHLRDGMDNIAKWLTDKIATYGGDFAEAA